MEKKKISISKLKFLLFISILGILVFASFYLHLSGVDFRHLQRISHYQHSFLLYIILYVLLSFFPMPLAPMSFLGAAIFPAFNAFIYSYLGSTLFCIVMFSLARFLGRDFIKDYENKYSHLKDFDNHLSKKPIFNLIMLRFFFIFPAEFTNIIAGLSKIDFFDYLFATLLGNFPVILFSTLIVSSRISHNNLLFFVSLIGLLLLLITPIIFVSKLRLIINKKYFKK